MLNQVMARRLKNEELDQIAGECADVIALTDRRLSALRRRRERDPSWKAYDPLVEDEVGIDVRIEEQEAVRWEAEEVLKVVDAEKARRKGRPQAAPPPILPRRYHARQATTQQARLF